MENVNLLKFSGNDNLMLQGFSSTLAYINFARYNGNTSVFTDIKLRWKQ